MSNENIKKFAFSERYVINLLFTNMGVGEGKEGGGVRKGTPLPSVKVLILNQCTFADVFGLFSLLVRQK